MAKQLNKQLEIDLTFKASTKEALEEIRKLSQTLTQIGAAVPDISNGFNSKAVKEASAAALELKKHLQSAVDINTGKLNLATFQTSLKSAGQNLNDLKRKIESLGSEGQNAFMQVSKAIAYAENPTKRVNAQLQEFRNTIMNTARWQISSSILHGFMGALSQAYGYAQDLNQSLNNIRIVTGYGTEEMADFAIQANKAAQALSTRTTNYTDAALIYYQQGIRDQKEIADRTDTTIKLANVSRQSAEDVSSQMTAIWNNFYDGSKSLEYYADVITALGATTASSSEEIAGGMQKFAAVAETVGLSYEYAASALATIVATTRQSEDTVGTGLRTIFSRLEGLKLGNTLEDGTDLNKYSAALKTVGVDILDTTGNLKNMDTILDETAARWDQLTKAQQVAFATTVGGVRQYTNLIALLDNWDQMQQNILTAKDSQGTLQKQQDIYAESWEASAKRVKAAFEEIYNKLLDDDFFIELNNTLVSVLGTIDGIIDSFGGLKGIISSVGGVFLAYFANQVPSLLNRIKEDIFLISGSAQAAGQALQTDNAKNLRKEADEALAGSTNGTDEIRRDQAAEAEGLAQIAARKLELNQKSKQYTQEELAAAQNEISAIEERMKRLQALGEYYENLKDKAFQLRQTLIDKGVNHDLVERISKLGQQTGAIDSTRKILEDIINTLKTGDTNAEQLENSFNNLKNEMLQAATVPESFGQKAKNAFDGIVQEIGRINFKPENVEESFNQLLGLIEKIKAANSNVHSDVNDALKDPELKSQIERLRVLEETMRKVGTAGVSSSNGLTAFNNEQRKLRNHVTDTSAQLTSFASVLMQISGFLNSMKRIKDVFTDEDASVVDKVSAAVSGLMTAIMMYNALAKATQSINSSQVGSLGALILAKFGHKTVTEAEAGAQELLNITLLQTIGIIGGVAIAIGVLIGIGKFLIDIYNKDAIAAEKAAEAAKNIGEQAEEAKQKVQNLQSAFDGYESVVEKLRNCTKGTKEWEEALQEVNNKVLEIMKEFPDLVFEMDISRENGQLVIKNLDEILEKAKNNAQVLQVSSIQANAREKQADLTSQKTDLDKEYSHGNLYIKTIIANIEDYSEALHQGKDAFKEALGWMYDNLSLSDTKFDSFYNSMLDLSNSARAVALELDNTAQTAAQVALGDQFDDLGENISNAIIVQTGEVIQKKQDDIYNDVIRESSTKYGRWQIGVEKTLEGTKDSIWQRYLKAIGQDPNNTRYKLDSNGVRGDRNHRTYAFKDASGEFQEITAEQMATTIAASESIKDLDKEANKLKDVFAQLSVEGQDVFANIINSKDEYDNYHLSEAYKNFNQNDLNEVLNSQSFSEENGLITKQGLESLGFTRQQFYELAEFLGYTVEELSVRIRQGAQDAKDSFEDLMNSLPQSVQKHLNELPIDIEQLDLQQFEDLSQAYNKLYNSGGSQALDELNNFINSFGEDKEKLVELFSSPEINFKDFNVDKQISEKLKELKIDIPKDFDVFIEKMRQLNNVQYPNIEETIGGMQTIQKEIAKLEFGKDIDPEIYDQLTEDQKKFFDYTSDGLLVLNTDAQTFYETVKQYNLETMFSELSRINKEYSVKTTEDLENQVLNRQNSMKTSKKGVFNDQQFSVTSFENLKNENYQGDNVLQRIGDMYSRLDILDGTDEEVKELRSILGEYVEFIENVSDKEREWYDSVGYTPDDIFGKFNGLNFTDVENKIYDLFTKEIEETKINEEKNDEIKNEELQKIVDYMLSMANSTSEANAIGEQIKASNQVDESIVDTAVGNRSHFLNIQDVADSADLSEAIAMAKEYELAFVDIQSVIMPLIQSEEDLALIRREYNQDLSNNIDLQILINNKTLELADNLLKLKNAYDEGVTSQGQFLINSERIINAMISSASSLQELDNAMSDAFKFESDMQQIIPDFNLEGEYLQYSQKLIELGQNSKTAIEETYHYSEALEDLARKQEEFYSIQQQLNSWSVSDLSDEDIIKMADAQSGFAEARAKLMEAEDNLRATIRASEGASKYGFDAKEIENQAKQIRKFDQRLRDLDDSYEMSAEDAVILAIANQRMNKGIATLNKNFKTWRNTLETTEKTSDDYAEAMTDVESAVADLIGAADDFDLPDGFLDAPENLDLIEKAAEGDAKAINEIGLACAKAQVELMQLDESFANAFDEPINQSTFNEAKEAVIAGIQEIRNNLDGLLDGSTTLGSVLDEGGADWVHALNEMAKATGMSVDTMNGLLGELGVQAKVTVASVPQQMEVPTYDEYSMWINDTEPQTASYTTPNGETQTFEIPQYHRRTWSTPGPTISVEGYTQVAQISTEGGDGGSDVPEINYVGTGGTSTANSGGSRGGGVSPSSTPAAKGSGGKGGSGSGGKKETKEKKNPTEEKERYHLINQQIERQTNLLDRLSKNKDRAFGPQKQQYYAKELKSLKDMGKMYEEHLRQSTDYLASDKAVMQQWGAIISDKDNSILNYDALIQAQVDAYNAAVDKYNNSAQEDADKEALEAAEKAYEQFLDDLKQYEDTVKQHEEDLNNYIDNIIQQYDTMKEKTAEAIEFRIEYDDDVLDFLDKLLDRLDSWNGSMYNAVDIMGKLNEQTGALVNKNKDLETGLHETLEHYLMDYKEYDKDGNLLFQTGLSYDQSNAFIDRFMNNQLTSDDIEFLSHLPAEEREAVKDLVSQLTDNADAIIENAQAVVDNVKKQFDDAKEEMDEASKPFERASEAFQNYADIIDIVGRDYLGVSDEIAKGLRQAEIDNAYFATVAAKAELESLAQQRDAVRDEMNKALADGNEELAEKYRDILKEMDDEVQSATETFHEKWQEQLQSVYEQMTATFEDIKKKSLDALTGPEGSPWSALKDQADYAKTAAEEYLPEYEKIYELSKLNRDINKSIDDTDNIKNKKALRDLQKEINKLAEENKEVSQYEIDNARKKYELELARLELEEAKNVKDIVRLSKDSEGNWSYIYTADEADVADAEQNYEDKLYALQQANADYINSLQDEWLTFTEDYMDKRIEIESDMTLQEEERKERLDALANYYADHERYLTEQLETAVDNNKDLYDDDWRWYRDYTKAKANLDTENAVEMAENNIYRLGNEKEFVTDWNDTFLGTQTAFETFEEFENNTTAVTENFVNQMDQEVVNFEQNTQRAMESAGTSVDRFAEDMMDNVENTILPESEAAKDKIVEMGDAAVEVMDNLIDQADSWRDQYNDIMDAIIEKNELVIESINKVNGALSLLETENIGHDANEAGEGEAPEGANGSGTGAGGPGNNSAGISPGGHEINEDSFRKIAAAIWVWNGAHAGWYTGADRRNRLIEKLGEAGANRVQQIINQEHDNLAFAYDWNALRNYFYSTFESGGYTGEWGNGGKFAMLHQKELVLNASDTENILGAVEMIRSISKSIDLNAMASQFAIGNLHAANANYGGNQLDQNVTITAEFPNATDRNEINEAFKMLINEASQYANRKNF